jgi:fibronectin type 3 domain-containing protein
MGSGVGLAVLIGLMAVQCGRERVNPYDPNFPQTSRPNPPSTVTATGSFGRITVTWVAPTGATEILGYGVYRAPASPTATYTFLRGDARGDTVVTTGGTSFVDSTFTGETTVYYYTITTVNKGRTASIPSNPARGELIKDTSPPAAPQNVSVQSDSISGAVTLSWSPPTTDPGGRELTGLSRFKVYRAEGTADAFIQLTELPADAKSFVDRNVKGGTRYFYQVSAQDPAGNESARSTAVQLVTAGVSVPTGLRATGDVGRIALAWNASVDDGLRGYNVYRSSQSDAGYVRLGPAGSFTTGQTAYTDSNLVGGSTFFYRVSAVTGRGEGAQSPFVSATAQADNVPPAAPGNLSAQLDERAVGRVTLTWSAPTTDNTGRELTGLSGYKVFRSKGGTTSFVQIGSTAQNTYVDTGLEPLTTYFYAVSAYDPSNNESGRTAPAQVATRGIATPSGVRATGDIGRITVVWNPNTETELLGYNVYRSTRSDTNYVRLPGNEGTTYTTGQTSYVDSNLVANSRFYYRVSAVGSGALGEGQRSVPVAATVLADDQPPAAPSNLLAELDASVITRVTLRWTAPSRDANGRELTGLSGYRVFRNNVQIATTSASTTSYVDNTVEPLTAYTYNVSAVDPTGNVSALSNTVPVTTRGVGVPANVTAVGDVYLIRVAWTANQERDLLGYRVYRSTTSSAGPYTVIPRTTGADTTITTAEVSFADSNLAAGTQRFYKVRAVTSSGVSDLSRFAVATALDDNRPPATPDINFFFVTVNTADARILELRWRAPTTDAGGAALTGLRGYRVYRAGTTGSFVQIAEVQHPTVTYTDSDPTLEFVTTYQYKVSAFDEKGNESAPTAAVSQQTGGVPPPMNLVVTATAVDATTGQAVVSWSAPTKPGAADYVVERQLVGTSSSSAFTVVTFTTNTTITDTGLSRGQTYAYRIRSRNAARTLQSDPTSTVPVRIP